MVCVKRATVIGTTSALSLQRVDVVLDHGAVLVASSVVGDDHSDADVIAQAELGVDDASEVVDIGALPEL